MSNYKQILSIGLDTEYGGGDFEYIPQDLENLSIGNLTEIQRMLVYFIGETERIRKKKVEESNIPCVG